MEFKKKPKPPEEVMSRKKVLGLLSCSSDWFIDN